MLVFQNDSYYIHTFVTRFREAVEITMLYVMQDHVKQVRSMFVSDTCQLIIEK